MAQAVCTLNPGLGAGCAGQATGRLRCSATAALCLVVGILSSGCGGEPELQVPPREVYFWPAEQTESIRREPQQRFFAITTLPPQVFFRAGSECGTVRSLSIVVEGWPAATGPSAAPTVAPAATEQFWLSDRHATEAARFVAARALDWEPRGGREVVEVRATEAGMSPTPSAAVRFRPGWLYRLTFLAQVDGGSYQRSIWLGPAGWQERALMWDAQ